MKKHCKKRYVDKKTNQGGPQQKYHIIEIMEEKESSFFSFMAKKKAYQHRSSTQYINLGASQHFTKRKDLFTKYTTCSSSDLAIFGSGEEYTIIFIISSSSISIQVIMPKENLRVLPLILRMVPRLNHRFFRPQSHYKNILIIRSTCHLRE
jgi:hypothetical protein